MGCKIVRLTFAPVEISYEGDYTDEEAVDAARAAVERASEHITLDVIAVSVREG